MMPTSSYRRCVSFWSEAETAAAPQGRPQRQQEEARGRGGWQEQQQLGRQVDAAAEHGQGQGQVARIGLPILQRSSWLVGC